MIGRLSVKSVFGVGFVLLGGCFIGFKLALSYVHDSSEEYGLHMQKNSPPLTRPNIVSRGTGGLETNTSMEAGQPCKRLWMNTTTTTSAWFKERFKTDLLPVWLKENMELTQPVSRWWLGLQSSKDKDYMKTMKKALEVVPNPVQYLDRNLSRCLRCAVVGNSGNLRNSNYGKLIDDHDVVLRINEAMTKGFEKDVGQKETHRMMYPENFRDIPPDSTFILLNFKVLDVAWLTSALTTGEIKRTYISVRPKIEVPPSKVVFYNPALMWHIHHEWIDGHGRYPSSGALGTFFALQYCDEVSVFGLGANSKGFWDHYWQKDDGARNSAFLKTHVHDSVHELEVIKRLAKEGAITFYEGYR